MGGFSGADELEQAAAYHKAVDEQQEKVYTKDLLCDIIDLLMMREFKEYACRSSHERMTLTKFYNTLFTEKAENQMKRRRALGLDHVDFEVKNDGTK